MFSGVPHSSGLVVLEPCGGQGQEGEECPEAHVFHTENQKITQGYGRGTPTLF